MDYIIFKSWNQRITLFKFLGSSLKVDQHKLTILIDLSQNDDIGCSVGLEDESNLFVWNVVFEGPPDTLYEVCEILSNKF